MVPFPTPSPGGLKQRFAGFSHCALGLSSVAVPSAPAMYEATLVIVLLRQWSDIQILCQQVRELLWQGCKFAVGETEVALALGSEGGLVRAVGVLDKESAQMGGGGQLVVGSEPGVGQQES